MIKQVLFLTSLQFLGMTAAALFKDRVPLAFGCVSGFLWGLLIWVLLAIAVMCTGVPFTAGWMFGLEGGITAALIIFNLRKHRFSSKEVILLSCTIAFFSILVSLGTLFNMTVVSYDSLALLSLGRCLAWDGGVDLMTGGQLAFWGVFVPLCQSASVFIGVDYLGSLQYAIFVTMLACFAYLSWRSVTCLNAPRYAGIWLSCLPWIALAGSYFLLFQAFYIHNSLPSAVFLLLFFSTAWLGLRERNSAWFVFSVAALIGFTLQRVEAPLFGLIFLAVLLSDSSLSHKTRMACAFGYCCVSVAWYSITLSLVGGGSPDFLTPPRILTMILGMGAYCILVTLSTRKFFKFVLQAVPIAGMSILCVGILALFIYRPENMDQSFMSILSNTFMYTGRWGSTWFFVVGLVAVATIIGRFPHDRLFIYGISLFFMVFLALGSKDVPYRIGWGGSGNRIITHILPTLVFALVLQYASGLSQCFFVRRKAVAAVVAVAFVFISFLLTVRPTDYAIGARVISGPSFCKGHGFEKALRGKVDHEYAAAARPGPAMCVLDLDKLVRAEVLETVYYGTRDAVQTWVDFAWHVSQDGKHWRAIFDTLSNDERRVCRPDHVTTRFDLRNENAFRFLRLTFRRSNGQNRLLLRKMAVISRDIYGFSQKKH